MPENPFTVEQLAADRATCEAATPDWKARMIDDGESKAVVWDNGTSHTFEPRYFKYVDGQQVFCAAFTVDGLETLGDYESGAMEKNNAEFCEAARTRWPAALVEIERLQAVMEEWPHDFDCESNVRQSECAGNGKCDCRKSRIGEVKA